MSFDDEFEDDFDYEESGFDDEPQDINGHEESEEYFDPLDITDPKSAYFFLSDDTQDELKGADKRKMKCNSCGHKYIGELYDFCPECFSPNTEESIDYMEDEENDNDYED